MKQTSELGLPPWLRKPHIWPGKSMVSGSHKSSRQPQEMSPTIHPKPYLFSLKSQYSAWPLFSNIKQGRLMSAKPSQQKKVEKTDVPVRRGFWMVLMRNCRITFSTQKKVEKMDVRFPWRIRGETSLGRYHPHKFGSASNRALVGSGLFAADRVEMDVDWMWNCAYPKKHCIEIWRLSAIAGWGIYAAFK